MLSRELIRSNPDLVKEAVRIRCDTAPIDEIVELDADQRKLKVESETLKAERNRISKSFGDKGLSEEQREELRAHAADLRDRVAELDRRTDELETRLHELELWVPNIPDPSVPLGTTEEDNVVIRSWGEPRHFSFQPQSHADLGESLGIFDSEDAVRMSGTRFYSLRGLGARLEHALGRFMLDIQVREHGFRETWIPYAVKSEAMIVSAQLPKFAEEAYYLQSEDLYLIPTGEVPLVNMETGKILDASQLPIQYAALSPCFRKEAGAAGRDTRGMIRVHQFDKVEMVVFCEPSESAEWLERLVAYSEAVLQRLELPYHVLAMNTSDLGFGQVNKYDPEVWMPSLDRYVEISSCSSMGDFQARRGRIRYRPEPGTAPQLVHTLNGSGLAVGRTYAAILENYQREDGSVEIPAPVVPYMDGVTELRVFA
ncbi:MAG TPA: serine--tRNA ligase [Chloroflexi bacterium]|jgi:seryl-tRNA synthetase|nr:serine--tRNA ligase [Chloroflexota bacterium]